MRSGKVSLRLMLCQIVSLLLFDNEFISSRKEIYFFPYENIFSPAKKFISLREKIYLLPYAPKFLSVFP